jgi:hypothetical protein
VFVEDLHERVWRARVVDVVSAVPAATTIETPTIIDCTNPKCLSVCATICFSVSDSFTSVFGNLSMCPKRFSGEATLAVNS